MLQRCVNESTIGVRARQVLRLKQTPHAGRHARTRDRELGGTTQTQLARGSDIQRAQIELQYTSAQTLARPRTRTKREDAARVQRHQPLGTSVLITSALPDKPIATESSKNRNISAIDKFFFAPRIDHATRRGRCPITRFSADGWKYTLVYVWQKKNARIGANGQAVRPR